MADTKQTKDAPELVGPTHEVTTDRTVEPSNETTEVTAMPEPAATTRRQQDYFFPPDFSCKADSLEDAIDQFEDHQKGAR